MLWKGFNMNKTINAWNKKADGILEASEKQLQDIARRIEDERAKAESWKEKMNKATRAADPAAFKTAKAAYTETNENIEMFEASREVMESGPLVSEDEYNDAINAIMDAIDAEHKQAQEQIFALVDEIKRISDNLETTIDDGNAALHKWQIDVYRDDLGSMSYATGVYIKEKKWRDDALLNFADRVTNQAVYREYKGLPVTYRFS